jgi:Concanavalin A-like lectin/glucanases superfamily
MKKFLRILACLAVATFALSLLLPPRAAAQCITMPTNIISWWRAEQDTTDTTGGNDGAALNGVTYATGKVGYAFLQTNLAAAVSLGNPTNLQVQNFTIETWIKRDSASEVASDGSSVNGVFLCYGTGGYGLGIQPNGLIFLTQVGDSQIPLTSASTPAVTDTNWHHLACVATNRTVIIYIDGSPTTVSTDYPATYTFSTDIAIGARGDNQECSFYGEIDEMSIYTNGLSSNQIWSIYSAGTNGGYGKCVPADAPAPPCSSAPSNMVTWWRGEENTLDSISGNSGTITNGVSYTNGEVEKAFSQSEVGAAVLVGNPGYLQIQNLTIEGWVKRSSTNLTSSDTNNGLFFSYGNFGYAFGIHPAGNLFWTEVGISEVDSSLYILDDIDWHHVAITSSNGVVWCYLDGAGGEVSTGYVTNFEFSSDAAIGARGDNQQCSFLGAIDELSIYNQPLTSNQLYGIYSEGAAGKCGPDITVQPANEAVSTGDTALFAVTASAPSASTPLTLSYQWYNGGTAIAGATASTYTISPALLSSAGNYSVLVSDAYASIMSSNATLTVPDDLGLHVFINQPLGASQVP